jgi:replication factor C large subunit
MLSILEKYKPKRISEVIGNRKQMEDALNFIKNFKKGKALFLYGPPGCGKSLSIELIAKELSYEIIELSPSDFRDYNTIKQKIFEAGKQRSLFGKGRIVLIDDVEVKDKGMEKAILELIKNSSYPVVLTANNPFEKSLATIRKFSEMIKFDKIHSNNLKAFLEKIAKKEGKKYEEKAIAQLARMANGDVRAALIDFETLDEITEESIKKLSTREVEQSIFDTLKVIFKTKSINTALLAARQSEKTPEEIFWWLEENLIKEYKKPEDLAKGFEYLAEADFFQSMIIKRQSWELQKYFLDSMAFVSIAKKESYPGFTAYSSPKIYQEKKIPKELKDVCLKIGSLTHCSSKKAAQYIPIFKYLVEKSKKAKSLFTKEEIDAIKVFKVRV